MTRSHPILTKDDGTPIPRPRREDYDNAVDYIRAVHAFNDTISGVANAGFDRALWAGLRR